VDCWARAAGSTEREAKIATRASKRRIGCLENLGERLNERRCNRRSVSLFCVIFHLEHDTFGNADENIHLKSSNGWAQIDFVKARL
jgi:hypothetical protein